MYFEEYGKKENPTIIMLHGAIFVDTFLKQYVLSDGYHLIIPHIMGFGRRADEVFKTDEVISELKSFIATYGKTYVLGFSLGAQLAFRLISESPELFKKAIIASPWIDNKENVSESMISRNLNMLEELQKEEYSKSLCRSMGMNREQTEKFFSSVKRISKDTIINCVDNKISFSTVESFARCPVPTLAVGGEREPKNIISSIEKMGRINPYCEVKFIPKAKHNLTTAFSDTFNKIITDYFS